VSASAFSRQVGEWERSPLITTVVRPLRYPGDWPDAPAQEKGIDVALAIDFLRLAIEQAYDVGILFSLDTDLVPALEMVSTLKLARVEVAAWAKAFRLRLPGTTLPWCHHLSRADYLTVADPTDYTKPSQASGR
jgi:NYN domain